MIKNILIAVVWMIMEISVLVGCQGHFTANPTQDVFSDITRKADSFGFAKATFYQLQAAFVRYKPKDFKAAFNYYRYGCGYYHTNVKDEVSALKYADSMLRVVNNMADASTSQAEIAIANLSKGDILFALQRYNEACEYYYKGKIAAEKSSDKDILSEYSYRLGMAMYRQENYSVAARYFINAFEESGNRNHSFAGFYRRQEVLGNVAQSYLNNNKPDSAVWYCNKGLRYISDNTNSFAADKAHLITVANGVLYGTLGQAYLRLHDTTGATWLQQSIAINAAPGADNGDALAIEGKLANYYLDTAFAVQLPKAYAVLSAMQKGLDTVHNDEAATQWSFLMSRYYALQGNKAEAYTYLTQYNTLYNRQMAANKALMETNISSRLKEMQDHYDLSMLENKNGLKTIYLQITVLLCLLTGIILLLMVRNWKKEKVNTRKLTLLNRRVQQQKIQLETTVKLLNEQIKTKDYILRIIAHDLRNPISAISTLTRIVSEEYENEADNKEFLEMAQSACKDSLAMIDSIMQLSQQDRPESLKQRILDVNETVQDCVELLRCKAAEKKQELVLHTTNEPLYILADADKISRVVNNLVMNAIKFSFPNSTIDVSVKDNTNSIKIEVKDEGIGIPADMQPKVFDVFTEAKRKGTSKESTFGLGLSICKQLVEAHGGKIWLQSKEGSGSTFHVQLNKHKQLQPKPELEAEVV